MIRILGNKLWLMVFTGVALFAGSIESSVDSKEIALGDSVLFSITVVGEESDPLPEMQEIGGIIIDQITRNKGSDFVHVNGKSIMQHYATYQHGDL